MNKRLNKNYSRREFLKLGGCGCCGNRLGCLCPGSSSPDRGTSSDSYKRACRYRYWWGATLFNQLWLIIGVG